MHLYKATIRPLLIRRQSEKCVCIYNVMYNTLKYTYMHSSLHVRAPLMHRRQYPTDAIQTLVQCGSSKVEYRIDWYYKIYMYYDIELAVI